MLNDLFRTARETDPKSVIKCQRYGQPNISISFKQPDYLPLPNIHFRNKHNSTIDCDSTLADYKSCSSFINKTTHIASSNSVGRPFHGSFLPKLKLIPYNGISLFELNIYITDPGYNASYQESAMLMEAYDRGKILIRS
ncbi:606_t:CDS:2 [Dentiscutata erythropus]|uniref:606_t:CDS:1 n=1 Tax=Dentiscutata erythropus TaxID=1348616 RepID=A0A9N9NMV7_9GLOM|nr:606_t:CDS:2 [Dentiscutata erythropus]